MEPRQVRHIVQSNYCLPVCQIDFMVEYLRNNIFNDLKINYLLESFINYKWIKCE